MIQILGLRPFTTRDGKQRMREVFFEKGWRLASVKQLVDASAMEELLSKIPDAEKWNLYYTVADCYEEREVGEKGRRLREQWAIPFDIDGLDLPPGEEHAAATNAARIAAEALGLKYEDLTVIFTGNGVQFLVHTEAPIVNEEYFDQARPAYHVLTKRIQQLLDERGVTGKVDVSVWSAARLLRLPSTVNRKPGKPERMAAILSPGNTSHDFDLFKASGVTLVEASETVSDEVLKLYPKPDTKEVCKGCKFLEFCREKPSEVREPQWYAMLSITSRLDDGENLSHQYSGAHPSYSHYETELKIKQALASAGPRTCKNIGTLWDGCTTCDHYGKVTSPIMIKGEEYIATKDMGFREATIDKNGAVKKGKPAYLDLIKHFNQTHPFMYVKDLGKVVRYNGKHWEFVHDADINAWATNLIRPEPMVSEMKEFLGQLKAHNVTSQDQLYKQREGLLNFQNCVLDVMTGETFPHSPKYGFFDIRPFDYDPHAKAPMWEKFLMDITEDEDLVKVLKEFGGYSISGDSYWMHKALVLIGGGRNGKSVYMETLGKVVGESNHAAVSMKDLNQNTMRFLLVNKLFNYSEESSVSSLVEGELFKTLTGGGVMSVKELYYQPYNVVNKAKIIISSNHDLLSSDTSTGMLERLAIINLNKVFKPGVEGYDPQLKYKLWEHELPGICNSLLAAYKDLKRRGDLPTSERITQALEDFRRGSDPILVFAEDCVIKDESAQIKALELYAEYVRMCELMGVKPANAVVFGRKFSKYTGIATTATRIEGAGVRVYKGIKINKEY